MRKKFHVLGRPKLRQTWNKYNLYNFSRAQTQRTSDRSFFQQKWTAKSITRAYHGETVREKMWTRMFRRTMRSVVDFDPSQLAKNDGSQYATGRGSGLDRAEGEVARPRPGTPYLNMVYAPLERRLDTAVFRALFASSTRQARQFVVHGHVKVNGKEMIYPGYQLNPGDMFQVDPERVLFGTGAPKDREERSGGRKIRRRRAEARTKSGENASEITESNSNQAKEATSGSPTDAAQSHDQTPKNTLKFLLNQAKEILSSSSNALNAKRKQDLRAFQRSVKRALSRREETAGASLDSQLQTIISQMAPEPIADKEEKPSKDDMPVMSTPSLQRQAASLNPEQMRTLRDALKESRENPVDSTKPYATPWRPRPFMSAFAFIPRYLEVNPRVCAAVYIRHPVARPGLAEVPTPFDAETNILTHNWYLRRR